jgi:Flp pilus assembly protein TadB
MDLKTETDAELISLQEKLNAWCLQHQRSKWGHRLWILIIILGVFAFFEGIVDIFFGGISSLNVFLILLGAITCFTWYKSDKQRKANIKFLAELNIELTRRNSNT